MTLTKELLDWAESLPEDQQKYAEEHIPILVRMGRDRVTQFMELQQARKRLEAYVLMVEAMTPTELLNDQKKDSEKLDDIKERVKADRKAKEKMVDDLFALAMRIAIAVWLKV